MWEKALIIKYRLRLIFIIQSINETMNRFVHIVLLVTILVASNILLNLLCIILLYIIYLATLARDFASGRFRGPCWRSGNCADICIGREGATGGHCHAFKCWCENNRGRRSVFEDLSNISEEQMYQANEEEIHQRFGEEMDLNNNYKQNHSAYNWQKIHLDCVFFFHFCN